MDRFWIWSEVFFLVASYAASAGALAVLTRNRGRESAGERSFSLATSYLFGQIHAWGLFASFGGFAVAREALPYLDFEGRWLSVVLTLLGMSGWICSRASFASDARWKRKALLFSFSFAVGSASVVLSLTSDTFAPTYSWILLQAAGGATLIFRGSREKFRDMSRLVFPLVALHLAFLGVAELGGTERPWAEACAVLLSASFHAASALGFLSKVFPRRFGLGRACGCGSPWALVRYARIGEIPLDSILDSDRVEGDDDDVMIPTGFVTVDLNSSCEEEEKEEEKKKKKNKRARRGAKLPPKVPPEKFARVSAARRSRTLSTLDPARDSSGAMFETPFDESSDSDALSSEDVASPEVLEMLARTMIPFANSSSISPSAHLSKNSGLRRVLAIERAPLAGKVPTKYRPYSFSGTDHLRGMNLSPDSDDDEPPPLNIAKKIRVKIEFSERFFHSACTYEADGTWTPSVLVQNVLMGISEARENATGVDLTPENYALYSVRLKAWLDEIPLSNHPCVGPFDTLQLRRRTCKELDSPYNVIVRVKFHADLGGGEATVQIERAKTVGELSNAAFAKLEEDERASERKKIDELRSISQNDVAFFDPADSTTPERVLNPKRHSMPRNCVSLFRFWGLRKSAFGSSRNGGAVNIEVVKVAHAALNGFHLACAESPDDDQILDAVEAGKSVLTGSRIRLSSAKRVKLRRTRSRSRSRSGSGSGSGSGSSGSEGKSSSFSPKGICLATEYGKIHDEDTKLFAVFFDDEETVIATLQKKKWTRMRRVASAFI